MCQRKAGMKIKQLGQFGGTSAKLSWQQMPRLTVFFLIVLTVNHMAIALSRCGGRLPPNCAARRYYWSTRPALSLSSLISVCYFRTISSPFAHQRTMKMNSYFLLPSLLAHWPSTFFYTPQPSSALSATSPGWKKYLSYHFLCQKTCLIRNGAGLLYANVLAYCGISNASCQDQRIC